MSDLPPCDGDLFKNGDVVGIYAANEGAKNFEKMIVELRQETGQRIDWNYAAGRAVVRCEPGQAAMFYELLSKRGQVAAGF
jgi:hypothetical protein